MSFFCLFRWKEHGGTFSPRTQTNTQQQSGNKKLYGSSNDGYQCNVLFEV